jgi:hypothetical protein
LIYLRTALAGLAGAAVGWLIAMGAAWLFGVWTLQTGVTTMALVGFGPPGAFFGLVLGITLQLYTRSPSQSFMNIWSRVLAITAAIVAVIGGLTFVVLHNLETIAAR